MSLLTQFFCVPFGPRYKLFFNTVYNSVNVIWPMENIIPREQYIKILRSSSTKTSSIRTWNGIETNLVSWDFTGSSMKIYIERKSVTIHCPIISMCLVDKEKLPYNSCVFSPCSERFIDDYDSTVFPRAKICLQDPYSSPVASAVPVAVPVAPTKLPPHITKLVLADSISKNETCPITCDPISKENGLVTSCGHVFTKDAIKRWLSIPSSKGECPVCKQACSI